MIRSALVFISVIATSWSCRTSSNGGDNLGSIVASDNEKPESFTFEGIYDGRKYSAVVEQGIKAAIIWHDGAAQINLDAKADPLFRFKCICADYTGTSGEFVWQLNTPMALDPATNKWKADIERSALMRAETKKVAGSWYGKPFSATVRKGVDAKLQFDGRFETVQLRSTTQPPLKMKCICSYYVAEMLTPDEVMMLVVSDVFISEKEMRMSDKGEFYRLRKQADGKYSEF